MNKQTSEGMSGWREGGSDGGRGGRRSGQARTSPSRGRSVADAPAHVQALPPPHLVFSDPPSCKDPQGPLPAGAASGEPARCPKRLLPRPQGCPAAPPCGRFGNRRCPPPAWGASSPRFLGRRWAPFGPGPSILGPRCLLLSSPQKLCLNPESPAARHLPLPWSIGSPEGQASPAAYMK